MLTIERIDGVVDQARVSTLVLANAVAGLQMHRKKAKASVGSESSKRISLAKLVRQKLVALASPGIRRHRKKADSITVSPLLVPLPMSAETTLAKYDI
jgi:hypothetical protein